MMKFLNYGKNFMLYFKKKYEHLDEILSQSKYSGELSLATVKKK